MVKGILVPEAENPTGALFPMVIKYNKSNNGHLLPFSDTVIAGQTASGHFPKQLAPTSSLSSHELGLTGMLD